MDLKQDAQVVTASGEDVGRIDRIVIDPKTNEITYVVVRKGFLFTEDKVVPINLIANTTDGRVTLRSDAGDLDKLPEYQETYYVPVDDWSQRDSAAASAAVPAAYYYPPYGVPSLGYAGWGMGAGMLPPDQVVETRTNIPEGDVALKNGANVITRDGKHVGDVDQVLTDPQSDKVSHIVISQGLLFKTRKLIPMDWVANVDEKEVHLAVGSNMMDRLRDYQE